MGEMTMPLAKSPGVLMTIDHSTYGQCQNLMIGTSQNPKSGGYHEISWDITSENFQKIMVGIGMIPSFWILTTPDCQMMERIRAVFDHVRIKTKKRKEHKQSICR